MNTLDKLSQLVLGQVVYKPKGAYLHAALVAGPIAWPFLPVLSLSPDGVNIEHWDLTTINLQIGAYLSSTPYWLILERAKSVAFRRYDAVAWNCEHFVRYCHGLKPVSPQVAGTLLLAGAAVLAYALAA